MASKPPTRDPRFDFWRGLALVLITLDHISGNILPSLLPRGLGYSDMAEVFVFLAGLLAGESWLRRSSRDGVFPAARHFWGRALGLTAAFGLAGLLLRYWMGWWQVERVMLGLQSTTQPQSPLTLSWGILTLQESTGPLAVLLLLALCLLLFPLVSCVTWPGSSCSPGLIWLLGGGSLWLMAQFLGEPVLAAHYPALYYNPLAWGGLFLLGAAWGRLPEQSVRSSWITAAAWLVLLAMLPLAGTSWAMQWSAKTTLGPLRMLHFLALSRVGWQLVDRNFAERQSWLQTCGRNSLAVFVSGAFLSVLGTRWLMWLGPAAWGQLVVNLAGLVCVLLCGQLADRLRFARASWQSAD